MTVDDPAAKAEVEAAFAAYERALVANDVAALDGFFVPTEEAIRYGSGENLYGYCRDQSVSSRPLSGGPGA